MNNPPDIKDLILEIIGRLGLNPTNVRSITFDATLPGVIVTEYLTDAAGKKYLDDNNDIALKATWVSATTRPTLADQKTAAKPASVPEDRVRPSTRPGGPRRSSAGTATLKGANLRTETETVEPVAEPEPPDEPEADEPDTNDDDKDDGQT